MKYPFDLGTAKKILDKKREILGRGLSYAEKILFLHETENTFSEVLRRGRDQIELRPDRVAMQDATAQMAMLQFIQAGPERTRVAATIHCDHLLRASRGFEDDIREALESNRDIYDFLSSAAKKYGIGFWGPGSGIIHHVVFENYAIPGTMMIGTDSHTPNAGGLGMIAIGVGGLDAAEVMAGLAWETTNPFIVGVRLHGKLEGWASAKDVIFEMLKRFTVKGGTGKIFEYFGEGAKTLSATQKATITNMGAELGATTSVFVYDGTMDQYLRCVGREEDAQWVKSVSEILTQDDVCTNRPEKVFDELIEIDLSRIEPCHAGPDSPDNVIRVRDFRKKAEEEGWPKTVSAVLLGSCTNSSYSDLCAAAHILEQAGRRGLKAKVPFLLSPGSRQVFETIKRDGILNKIVDSGATILSPSCGPCIGQWDRKDVKKGVPNCLFTTFNRNFRGRNDANPETRAFLTSPAQAAALAVSGDVGFDPARDHLTGEEGEKFLLEAPEVPDLPADGMVLTKEGFVPPDEDSSTAELKINPQSDRIELLQPFEAWDGGDFTELPVLVKTSGKTTTDHISPGGMWLRFRGHLRNISRNFLQGATNAFTGEVGSGTNIYTGEKGVSFYDLALFYREKAGGFIIVGDENYGEGSSREHAAMTPRYLGAKAIIARSFARIHEVNLKKQGILPLTFQHQQDYDLIEEDDLISITGLKKLQPGKAVRCIIKKNDGTETEIFLDHSMTRKQIDWFRAGSALNTLKRQRDKKTQGKR